MPGRGRKQQVVRSGYLRPPILHDGKAAESKPVCESQTSHCHISQHVNKETMPKMKVHLNEG